MILEKEPYSVFSEIYNHTIRHVSYKRWSLFILNGMAPYRPESILDLGCGTGELLFFMPNSAQKIGLDRSPEMLGLAKKRNANAEFIQGTITDYHINQDFDLITCTHDTLNYLLEDGQLEEHFLRVAEHLSPKGFYFFDVNTEYNLKYNFHKKKIKEKLGDLSLEWTNEYESDKRQIISVLKFTRKTQDTVLKWEETHIQRFYPEEQIGRALQNANLKILKKGSDYEVWDLQPKTSLLNYLVQKY